MGLLRSLCDSRGSCVARLGASLALWIMHLDGPSAGQELGVVLAAAGGSM